VKSLAERGFKAAGILSVGEPVEEICRVAKEIGAELIVVGHNQNTSFAARWWKGSVGGALIDYAPCSVLIAMSKG
jgi:nucleotide-binding universal stress UspA family protein